MCPSSVCSDEPQRRHLGGRAHERGLCHFQQWLHWTTVIFLVRKRALVTVPKRRSWFGREAFEASEKLINQLEEGELVSAVLAVVWLTDTGVWPVCSVISADRISGLTGKIEYWLLVIWPMFLGTFVTL